MNVHDQRLLEILVQRNREAARLLDSIDSPEARACARQLERALDDLVIRNEAMPFLRASI
ncbi:MAG: hypothetical protein J0I77_17680 [Rudaea sp.]|uniref:hypothetical protein n=1 Tax=Rudaea sp. TaxID=2136325 RepID=UPI001AD3F959|nr:hypothetical protein [Rudaea sp.]MBN8887559.1 hypothetical protein [Rudaea sp.]